MLVRRTLESGGRTLRVHGKLRALDERSSLFIHTSELRQLPTGRMASTSLFADEAVRQHKLAAADTWVHREQQLQTEAEIAASAYKDEALAAALASRDRQRRARALDELLPGLYPVTGFQHQILLQTEHQRDVTKPWCAELDRRERAAAAARWKSVREPQSRRVVRRGEDRGPDKGGSAHERARE